MADSLPSKTIEGLLGIAISVEDKSANLYDNFSKLFSEVPEIFEFWQSMKVDEIEHANILKNISKALSLDQLSAHPNDDIWKNVIQIREMLSSNLVGSIKNLDDAYEIAHEIEFHEVNGLFKFLTLEIIPFEKQEEFIIGN